MNVTINETGKSSMDRINKILSGIPGGAYKVVYSALKRAGERAKTQAGKYASAEYAISKSEFMNNTTMKMRNSKGSGVASMEIAFAGHVLPLLSFNTKFSKDGSIQTQVMRNGGSTTLERAFVARAYGRTGVFERVGAERYPIEGLYGPSTAHMMENESVIEKMDKTIEETYEQRIEHEILRVLNGWGG